MRDVTGAVPSVGVLAAPWRGVIRLSHPVFLRALCELCGSFRLFQ